MIKNETFHNQQKNRATNKANDSFTRLYNIGLVVGAHFSLQEALSALYQECSHLLDVTNFAVALYDKQTDILSFMLVFSNHLQYTHFVEPLSQYGLAAYVVRTQNTLIIPDLDKINNVVVELNRIRPEKPIRTWLGVPIPNLIKPLQFAHGVMMVWGDQPNQFTNRDLQILSAIANQSAVAIRYVQMLESLHHRAMEMAVINEIAQSLTSTLDLSQVASEILEQVEHMIDVEAGILLLRENKTSGLTCHMAFGAKTSNFTPFELTLAGSLAEQVFETKEPVIIRNATHHDYAKTVQQRFGLIVRNILCMPLKLREVTIGVLELYNKRAASFSAADAKLLTTVLPFATVALENARLHEHVLKERDRVIDAGEEARRELARDLHDGPIQLVSDIAIRLSFCQEAIKHNTIDLLPNEINYMQEVSDRAIHQMRTTLFELRPLVLETDGLAAAIEIFLDRRQTEVKTAKLSLKIRTTPPENRFPRLAERVEKAIFAIVQESVNNALKHAQAKNIIVQLTEAPEALYVVIADDGKGFVVSEVLENYSGRASLGMVNIKERTELIGSELTIKSAPEMGTQIFVYVPKHHQERLRNRTVVGLLEFPLRV